MFLHPTGGLRVSVSQRGRNPAVTTFVKLQLVRLRPERGGGGRVGEGAERGERWECEKGDHSVFER